MRTEASTVLRSGLKIQLVMEIIKNDGSSEANMRVTYSGGSLAGEEEMVFPLTDALEDEEVLRNMSGAIMQKTEVLNGNPLTLEDILEVGTLFVKIREDIE